MTLIARPAVLFVDLQEGLIEAARTQSPSEVRRGARALAQFARALSLPCFASGIPAGPQGAPPLLKEIATELPDLVIVERRSFGAWASPAVRASVGNDIDRLLVAGVLTEAAVMRTAQEILGSGLAVTVVLDACAGLSSRTETAALRKIEYAGGSISSVASLATELVEDLSSPEGRAVLAALRGLLAG